MQLDQHGQKTLQDIYVCLMQMQEGTCVRFTVLTKKTPAKMEQWLCSILQSPTMRLDTCMSALQLVKMSLNKGLEEGFFVSASDGVDRFIKGTDEALVIKEFEATHGQAPVSWCNAKVLEQLLLDLQEDMEKKDVLIDPEYVFE